MKTAAVVELSRLARARPCRCHNEGPIHCSECDGHLRAVSARTERQELLRTGALEAARSFMAWQLREERAGRKGIFSSTTVPAWEVVEAFGELRDALQAERCARG